MHVFDRVCAYTCYTVSMGVHTYACMYACMHVCTKVYVLNHNMCSNTLAHFHLACVMALTKLLFRKAGILQVRDVFLYLIAGVEQVEGTEDLKREKKEAHFICSIATVLHEVVAILKSTAFPSSWK